MTARYAVGVADASRTAGHTGAGMRHPTGAPAPGPAVPAGGPTAGSGTGRWRRLRRHLPLAALLAGTAALYLVGLSRSGWANQFYAAAAQSGSRSWTAFLFGSLDQSNFITVDKPPAALWIMDISVKLFGVNSWAILLPQALEGVAAVALLYAAVRRVGGTGAGLLAGAALATTPVATLIFRYDNPDALLVLLMTAAAYATVRAIDGARPRWLALAGALLGMAFLTKMLQGMLVVPAFAAAYLICAPAPLRSRIGHTAAAGGALVVAGGWWVALVELWPAGSRPYIGGSNHNSVLELIFGYNGIGRLTGADNNGNVTGGTGGFSSGSTGLTRLFGSEMGTQISWLLPAALVAIGVLLWQTRRAPRTDPMRAATIVWGGWLLVTGAVFSFASGIIHPYYTVALAPAIAAVTGLAVAETYRARAEAPARPCGAALVAITACWTFVLLGRATWHPELRWVVLLAGAAAVTALLLRLRAAVVAPLLAVALLAAPSAYSVQTAATAHTGALPTAGPASFVGAGGRQPVGPSGGPGASAQNGTGGGTPGGGAAAGNPGFGNPGGRGSGSPGLGGPGQTGAPNGAGFAAGPGGAIGGLGGAATVSADLRTALQTGAGNYTWVAATTGDNEAATLELATGEPVMALGGYNGTDPAITLASFQKLVKAGEVHYYIPDRQGFIGSTSAAGSTAYAIQQWVESTFTATTIGGTTVYDLR